MKLLIKKKYFDEIKSGKKRTELRDAHITFICEETKEELRKEVHSLHMEKKSDFIDKFGKEELDNLFEDEWLMEFHLH